MRVRGLTAIRHCWAANLKETHILIIIGMKLSGILIYLFFNYSAVFCFFEFLFYSVMQHYVREGGIGEIGESKVFSVEQSGTRSKE